MDKEAQRIAIAKACGWKFLSSDQYPNRSNSVPPKTSYYREGFKSWPNPPDYLNDLNAMHEAEKMLVMKQEFTFRKELCRQFSETPYPDIKAFHAMAAQRAEAFLKSLRLWEEEEESPFGPHINPCDTDYQ